MTPAEARRYRETFAVVGRAMNAVVANMRRLLAGEHRWELDDPAWNAARYPGARGVLRQVVDVVRHDFWVAAEQPWRSPGARRVVVRAGVLDVFRNVGRLTSVGATVHAPAGGRPMS